MAEKKVAGSESEISRVRLVGSYSPGERPGDYEVPIGISVTVPDEAYTVRELMARHAAGMLPDVMHQDGGDELGDFDSEDLEKLRDSDLYERQEAYERIGVQLREQREQFDVAEKERKRLESDRFAEDEAVRKAYRLGKQKPMAKEDVASVKDDVF